MIKAGHCWQQCKILTNWLTDGVELQKGKYERRNSLSVWIGRNAKIEDLLKPVQSAYSVGKHWRGGEGATKSSENMRILALLVRRGRRLDRSEKKHRTLQVVMVLRSVGNYLPGGTRWLKFFGPPGLEKSFCNFTAISLQFYCNLNCTPAQPALAQKIKWGPCSKSILHSYPNASRLDTLPSLEMLRVLIYPRSFRLWHSTPTASQQKNIFKEVSNDKAITNPFQNDHI